MDLVVNLYCDIFKSRKKSKNKNIFISINNNIINQHIKVEKYTNSKNSKNDNSDNLKKIMIIGDKFYTLLCR